MAEDAVSRNGFMNSGLTCERVRAAVVAQSGRKKPITTNENIPFSREVRKTFEAATNVRLSWRGICSSYGSCKNGSTVVHAHASSGPQEHALRLLLHVLWPLCAIQLRRLSCSQPCALQPLQPCA